MDIYIFSENFFCKFIYEFDGEVFIHNLESPMVHSGDSLFMLALLSRPINANKISVHGISVKEKYRKFFEKRLGVPISCNIGLGAEPPASRNSIDLDKDAVYLSFSGGFDSIASKAIIGEMTKLVSIDFGGYFSREAEFFRKFNTDIFKWDIRDGKKFSKKFNENIDWRFMLAPAASVALNRGGIVATGTIMEASPYWFLGRAHNEFNSYSAFGMNQDIFLINPIASLTEYSTTKIAYEYLGEENIQLSLKSLASESSFKSYRKAVLLSLVADREMPRSDGPKYVFGSSLADDFLTLYVGWRRGWKWVGDNYAKMPHDFNLKLNMRYVEKYFPNNLNSFCDESVKVLKNRFANYRIMPFDSNDLVNHQHVCEYLKVKFFFFFFFFLRSMSGYSCFWWGGLYWVAYSCCTYAVRV